MRHILSILVENEAGALSRISGLFSARGYNIESLTVAPTEDPTMSRMTIVTVGSEDVVEQITKQLNKLVEVVKVVDLTEGNHIERELMLVKVRASGKDRDEMKRLADIFRGRILDVTDKSYTIELTGTGSQARRVHPVDRARRHPRDRAHRRLRHRPRRANPPRLNHHEQTDIPRRNGNDEGLLRKGCRPVPHQGQEGDDRRLRLAGARARAEPQRLGGQGHRRPASVAARRGTRRRRPGSRWPRWPTR